MERYFVIFMKGELLNGNEIMTNFTMTTTNGNFFCKKEIQNKIKANYSLRMVQIVNFFEFKNKQDFDFYNG